MKPCKSPGKLVLKPLDRRIPLVYIGIKERMVNMFKFNNESTALSFRFRCSVPMRVVLGDDDCFWVTTPAVAARLEAGGHTVIA